MGTLLERGYVPAFIGGTEAVALVDGVCSVGPDTTEPSIARLYRGLLGRQDDPGGADEITARTGLLRTVGRAGALAALADSAEAKAYLAAADALAEPAEHRKPDARGRPARHRLFAGGGGASDARFELTRIGRRRIVATGP
jgi:hypothetical protein